MDPDIELLDMIDADQPAMVDGSLPAMIDASLPAVIDASLPRDLLHHGLAIALVYLSLGLSMAGIGPSLIMLGSISHSSPRVTALIFPMREFGGMVGAALGGLLMDKWLLDVNALTAVGLLCSFVLMSALPFCSSFWWLVAVNVPGGVSYGVLAAATNLALCNLQPDWIMQLGHFFYAVGALLAPLIVAAFTGGKDESRLGLAFVVSSSSFLVMAAVILRTKRYKELAERKRRRAGGGGGAAGEEAASSVKQLSARELLMVYLAGLLLTLAVGAEVCFSGFIFSYAVDFLGIDELSAAGLTSLFWTTMAVGRFAAIFLSTRLSPRAILTCNLVGCLLGALPITVFPRSVNVLWLGTVIYGLSMSCAYPTVMTLISSYFPITGRAATILGIGASLGEFSVPLIAGAIFGSPNKNDRIWLIYITTICAAVQIAVFLVILRLGHGGGKKVQIFVTL